MNVIFCEVKLNLDFDDKFRRHQFFFTFQCLFVFNKLLKSHFKIKHFKSIHRIVVLTNSSFKLK